MNEPVTSWPSAVVNRAFEQHLAETLHHAALDLAFHQHRIDDGAEIIDRGVFHRAGQAGVRIDFDLGDMNAIRVSAGDLLRHMRDIERGGHALRQLDAGAQAFRQLHDVDRAVGARNDEAPAFEFDVAGGRFQNMRRQLFCPVR